MKNQRKGPLSSSIDLMQIPGYRARFNKIDQTNTGLNMTPLEKPDVSEAKDEFPLRDKLGSHQDIRSNPGVILRRYGMKT